EEYGICMPESSAVVTAAVDVQKDRLEVLTKCWGYDEESWDLEYIVLHGNTVQPEVWHQLDVFLQKTYPHMNGSQVGIHGTIIDTSYQPSPIVYEFIKQRQSRNIMGIKGSSIATKPLIPPRASRRNKGKINLYEIGVNTGKDLLRARLQLAPTYEGDRNPGFIHFPLRFGQSFFQQLTAEKKILKYKKGRPYYEWVNVGKHRNEALDIEVYSIAALKLICPDVAMLNRLVDQARQKKTPQSEPKDTDKAAKRPARRKGGFVHNW
ncbi:MAG: terminase gpA endonuclease subunit, partial [Spirochaetota bacterium]